MPKFTTDLSPAAVNRLQKLVTRYNDDNGTDLSLAAWLLLHLRETAIQEELQQEINQLREQTQADANTAFAAAVNAPRGRLLAEV